MTAGTSGSGVLLPQRFDELNIGTLEVILGAMNSVGCIFVLFANIIFGALSDITRSRFGKRTPWIVAGGFVTAAGYVLAFSSASLAGIVAGWSIVQVGVNMMIAPAVAVLSDRIPENVRGTFSSFYGGAMIVGQSAGTFLGSKFIDTMGVGFVIGAVLFAITGILTIIIWPAERGGRHQGEREAQPSCHCEVLHSADQELPRLLSRTRRPSAADFRMVHDLRLPAVHSQEVLRT